MRTGAWIEIDRNALRSNYRAVRDKIARHSASTGIYPVVKANAYGHGLVSTARTWLDCGAAGLCVAFASEAQQLREALGPALDGKPLLALVPPLPGDADRVCAAEVDVMATEVSTLQHLSRVAVQQKRTIRVHLYVDTGMHRDGVAPGDALSFLRETYRLPGLSWVGICTHFATADEGVNEIFKTQLECFAQTKSELSRAGFVFPQVHTANSAALFLSANTHGSLVRPGLALYGYNPGTAPAGLLQPALTLKSRVVSLRTVRAGETVGYGSSERCHRTTQVASISIGYADGWSRLLSSGRGSCLIRGIKHPLIGRICMDQCMVDVGSSHVQLGDEVTLIGKQGNEELPLEMWSQMTGTIPYETLTSLPAHLERVFVEKTPLR